MLSDEWLPRYRLLENFTAKWNGNGNGNGNAYDRGDYNSSFALRAVELKTKTHISFAVTAKLISALVFATWIVQSLFFLNPKFQVSNHLLWLYRLVCVGPGRKPRRPVSHNKALIISLVWVRHLRLAWGTCGTSQVLLACGQMFFSQESPVFCLT